MKLLYEVRAKRFFGLNQQRLLRTSPVVPSFDQKYHAHYMIIILMLICVILDFSRSMFPDRQHLSCISEE